MAIVQVPVERDLECFVEACNALLKESQKNELPETEITEFNNQKGIR